MKREPNKILSKIKNKKGQYQANIHGDEVETSKDDKSPPASLDTDNAQTLADLGDEDENKLLDMNALKRPKKKLSKSMFL